jgi:hypothetical protein
VAATLLAVAAWETISLQPLRHRQS